MRVALSGPDDGRVLPRPGGPGRAAVHRQHLPLRPGRLRGLGAARPDALAGRLPADARVRDGPAPGADHLDPQGLGHLDPGDLRARPTTSPTRRRPRRSPTSTRPRRCRGRSPRRASTRPSTRSTRPRRSSRPRSSARSTSASPTRSRRCSSATASCRTSSRSSASTSSPTRTGVTVNRARKLERFLSQPFHVAEQFTGTPGVYVPIAESIRGFKEILEGKHDDLPERAFFMKGTIDEVVKEAEGRRGRGRRRGEDVEDVARTSPSADEARSAPRSEESGDGAREVPVEVLTPEGEVFNDEVEMVSTRTAVGLDRRAGQPRAGAGDARSRPSCGCTRPSPRSSRFAQAEGYMQVADNRALMLVEEAHAPERARRRRRCATACSRPSASSRRPARTPSAGAWPSATSAAASSSCEIAEGCPAPRRSAAGDQPALLSSAAACSTSAILAERLISYDTSRPEELVAAAGFVKGWLESRDIEVRDHEHNGLPVLVAEVGAARRPSAAVRGLPRPSRRRARAPRAVRAAGRGRPADRPRRLRHEGRPGGDDVRAQGPRAPGPGPRAARVRARRGVRGARRALHRRSSSSAVSAATSRSPASRPTCTSASRPRACW